MQFSLFGAEAAETVLGDLDGLLLAGGDWVRTDRDAAARLSVLVADQWRATALQAELAARQLASDTISAPGDLIAVRTEFTDLLKPCAARWTRGASLRVPADLVLSAAGLRLWTIASGRCEEAGYLLGTAGSGDTGGNGRTDAAPHRAGGRQLAALGVPAADIGVKARSGWRITSAKRLRRLAELVGQPPEQPGRDWPVG